MGELSRDYEPARGRSHRAKRTKPGEPGWEGVRLDGRTSYRAGSRRRGQLGTQGVRGWCPGRAGPSGLRSVGVDHAQAEVSFEGIEIGVTVEQLVPVRDGVGRDETADSLANGDPKPPQ